MVGDRVRIGGHEQVNVVSHDLKGQHIPLQLGTFLQQKFFEPYFHRTHQNLLTPLRDEHEVVVQQVHRSVGVFVQV